MFGLRTSSMALALVGGLLFASAPASQGHAQDWPTRSVGQVFLSNLIRGLGFWLLYCHYRSFAKGQV